VVALAVLVVAPAGGVFPRAQGDLARAAQNPAASMISLPFQPDSILGNGPDDDFQNVLKDDVIEPDNIRPGTRTSGCRSCCCSRRAEERAKRRP
jgi:hypothetical protein